MAWQQKQYDALNVKAVSKLLSSLSKKCIKTDVNSTYGVKSNFTLN